MYLHQANKDKPRAQKCRHFCFSFDTYNFCPTCREAGKGDDPCVTFEAPCHICTSLTDEQLQKIQNRKRYLKKQKAETSSKDELDLLGEGDGDSFTGSNADLESAADNLFTSPPRPQPLAFSSLSLKTPAKAVPPTPGTVLQNKIQRNLEKSLGDSLNIHIQQQMGSFQASMLEAFQSLLVAKPLKCDERRRPSSQGPQYPTLYRRLKRRLGRSLRSKFYKRAVVRAGKKATHKCPRIEGGLPGPSRLQGPVPESNSVSCDGQLNSGSLHQQARGNSLSRDVRSPVENHDLVPSLPYNIESQAHSRVSECDGRPPIQVQPSAVNRMVSAPSGLQANLPKVVHPSCRLIRHSPESQTPSICVSYPRPKGLEHRCSEHKLDQPHGLRLPSYGSPSQGDPKDQAMPLPDHRDSPRLARDALVLGPSAALNRDPTTTPSVNDPTQTVPQLCVPQQLNLHTRCLGADNSKNKASLWRWQRELLPLSGHQQGPSTGQSGPYLKNGAEKIRWISPLHL